MESVDLENKNSSQKVDRVVLDPSSMTVIQRLSEQISNEIGDLVQVSQKDIINFLIRERSFAFTEAEISKIKNEHFDIVRALKRATQEAIKAKQDGNEIKINELLKIIQTPSVMQNSSVKKPRGRKKKVYAHGATLDGKDGSKDNFEAINSANNSTLQDVNTDSKIEENKIFPSKKST